MIKLLFCYEEIERTKQNTERCWEGELYFVDVELYIAFMRL